MLSTQYLNNLADLIEDVLEALLCEGGALDVLDGAELLGEPLPHLQAQRLLLVLCCKEWESVTGHVPLHVTLHVPLHVTQPIRLSGSSQLVTSSTVTGTHTEVFLKTPTQIRNQLYGL